jgi:hypothetical protein
MLKEFVSQKGGYVGSISSIHGTSQFTFDLKSYTTPNLLERALKEPTVSQVINEIKEKCLNPNKKIGELILSFMQLEGDLSTEIQEKLKDLMACLTFQEASSLFEILEKYPIQFGQLLFLIQDNSVRSKCLHHVINYSTDWERHLVCVFEQVWLNFVNRSDCSECYYKILNSLNFDLRNRFLQACLVSLPIDCLKWAFLPIYQCNVSSWNHFFEKFFETYYHLPFHIGIGYLLEFAPDPMEGFLQLRFVKKINHSFSNNRHCKEFLKKNFHGLSLSCQVKLLSVMEDESQIEFFTHLPKFNQFIEVFEKVFIKIDGFGNRCLFIEKLGRCLSTSQHWQRFFIELNERNSPIIPYLFAGLNREQFEILKNLQNVKLKTALLIKCEQNMEAVMETLSIFSIDKHCMKDLYSHLFFEIRSQELNTVEEIEEQLGEEENWTAPLNSYTLTALCEFFESHLYAVIQSLKEDGFGANVKQEDLDLSIDEATVNFFTNYQMSIPQIPALLLGVALLANKNIYKLFWKMAPFLTREQLQILCLHTPSRKVIEMIQPLERQSRSHQLSILMQNFSVEQLEVYLLAKRSVLQNRSRDFFKRIIRFMLKLSLKQEVLSYIECHHLFLTVHCPQFICELIHLLVHHFSPEELEEYLARCSFFSPEDHRKFQEERLLFLSEKRLEDEQNYNFLEECNQEFARLTGQVNKMMSLEFQALELRLKSLTDQEIINEKLVQEIVQYCKVIQEWEDLLRQPNLFSMKIEEIKKQMGEVTTEEDPYSLIDESFWSLLKPSVIQHLKLENLHSLTYVGIRSNVDLAYLGICEKNQILLDRMIGKIRSLIVCKEALATFNSQLTHFLDLDFSSFQEERKIELEDLLKILDLRSQQISIKAICSSICEHITDLTYMHPLLRQEFNYRKDLLDTRPEENFLMNCRWIIKKALSLRKNKDSLFCLKHYLEQVSDVKERTLASIWEDFRKQGIASISQLVDRGVLTNISQLYQLHTVVFSEFQRLSKFTFTNSK